MGKIFFLVAICFVVGCGQEAPVKQQLEVSGYAQGTTYKILYISEDGVNYQRSIDSLLIAVDNSLSTYQKKSIISKFNQSEKSFEVDQLFIDVFDQANKVYTATNGAFDPTIAPIVNAWGFGFEKNGETDSLRIDSLLHYVGFNNVSRNGKIVSKKTGMMLDFNAIAQGYTVDVLADMLAQKGVSNYLVEVGGELKSSGLNLRDTLWRVGINTPLPGLEAEDIEAIVNLDNKSLATSGNYRKFYEKDGVKYSHTISPKTGFPVKHNLLSATVITEVCAMADAYATAFMVMGLDESIEFLKEHNELMTLLIYSDENGDLQTFTTENLREHIELNPEKR